MSHRLPEKGLWHVTDSNGADPSGADPNGAGRHRADAAPFDMIKLDLRDRGTGTAKGMVRARNLETRLGRIRLTTPDRFIALYDIRGHRGIVEGTVRPDGSLRLDLTGTVTGTFVARAAASACAEHARAATASAVRSMAGVVDAQCRTTIMARTAA